MPSKSKAQARVMEAVAHGWKPKGAAKDITPAVAKEFVAADKARGAKKMAKLPARKGR